ADTADETMRKAKQMVTDRTRIAKSDPGHTAICEVPWPWYQVFDDPQLRATVKDECESAKIGCLDCKKRLGGLINEKFQPFRERREKLAKDPSTVKKLLHYGNKKARTVAQKTLSEMQEIMGLVRWETSEVSF
ncbi:MAG TPA: hypothetical protein V6D17_08025, partial [Candidatus Obscuribacterales bacterium]